VRDWEQTFTKVGALVAFLLVNVIITFPIVIAPSDSAAAELASTHKELNLLFGVLALGLALWRRWYGALFLFSVAQAAVFILIVERVNGNG
jgi:hypothetical protein